MVKYMCLYDSIKKTNYIYMFDWLVGCVLRPIDSEVIF